jgi:hypothetical protein
MIHIISIAYGIFLVLSRLLLIILGTEKNLKFNLWFLKSKIKYLYALAMIILFGLVAWEINQNWINLSLGLRALAMTSALYYFWDALFCSPLYHHRHEEMARLVNQYPEALKSSNWMMLVLGGLLIILGWFLV